MGMQTAIQKKLDTKLAQAAVVQHNAVEEHETSTGLGHRKLLMWTFLGSECMFFGSLIATFLVYRNQSTVGPFPDEIIDVPITTVSTFVLLMSSLAMVLALNAVQRNQANLGRFWILMTALLGSAFLGFQAFEFTEFFHEGLTPRINLFGTTFFILTGFHGVHVTVGVIWLLVMAGVITPKGLSAWTLLGAVLGAYAILTGLLGLLDVIPRFDNIGGVIFIIAGTIAMLAAGARHFSIPTSLDVTVQADNLEITGLYWHFVDIVWIVIFTVIYLVSANDSSETTEAIISGLHGG